MSWIGLHEGDDDGQRQVEAERGSYAFEAQRDARLSELVDEAIATAEAALRAVFVVGLLALIAGVLAGGAIVLAILGR